MLDWHAYLRTFSALRGPQAVENMTNLSVSNKIFSYPLASAWIAWVLFSALRVVRGEYAAR